MGRTRRGARRSTTALAVGLVGTLLLALGPAAGARETTAPPPVEEPGPDRGNAPDGTRPPAAPPAGRATTIKDPASPSFGPTIDELQAYVGQSVCDPVAKPGVSAFRDLLLKTYPTTGSSGIIRACSIGSQSEHKDGRAWDWQVSAYDPAQKAIADHLLEWLLAGDPYGNTYARVRRLGIMYIIWNRRIWKSYDVAKGWQAYTGASAHTDHVHFSFSIPGSLQQTTWWHPDASLLPAATSVGTPADFDGNGVDDRFLFGPGSQPDAIRWSGAVGSRLAPEEVRVTAASTGRPRAGDFDGNGASDVFWYGAGSVPDELWLGTPGSRSFTVVPQTVVGTYQPFVGDFDGNRVDDIFWYAPGETTDRIRWGAVSTAFGVLASQTTDTSVKGTYQPVPADLDGNGATDIFWYGSGTQADGRWIATVGGRTFRSLPLTIDGTYRPFAGDFDGNGVDDLFFYAPGTAVDRIRWGRAPGSLAYDNATTSINGTYLPMTGDLNGDGATDITWYGVGAATDARWSGTLGARTFVPGLESIPGTYHPF